jgi:peptidoglycan/LPS O-acetylase OafA/YrhL
MAGPETSATPPVELQRLGYVPALDGIRAFAVLFVMSYHVGRVFARIDPFLGRERSWIGRGGFLGVDLFFVLSGFLITSLLLGEQSKTGRISLGGFYRRRALRLLPALLAMLTVHLLYTVVTGLPLAIETHSIAAVVLYVANWYRTTGHPLAHGLTHLWSLSVEEQFYVLWPVVTIVVLGVRRSLRFAVTASIVGIAVRAYCRVRNA